VYNIGDATRCIYFIKSGEVEVIICFERFRDVNNLIRL